MFETGGDGTSGQTEEKTDADRADGMSTIGAETKERRGKVDGERAGRCSKLGNEHDDGANSERANGRGNNETEVKPDDGFDESCREGEIIFQDKQTDAKRPRVGKMRTKYGPVRGVSVAAQRGTSQGIVNCRAKQRQRKGRQGAVRGQEQGGQGRRRQERCRLDGRVGHTVVGMRAVLGSAQR